MIFQVFVAMERFENALIVRAQEKKNGSFP